MKYFFDINMGDINERHLFGTWTIESSFTSDEEIHESFANCGNISLLEDGTFNTAKCNAIRGVWTMNRDSDLIYNPRINFYQQQTQIAKAIITRLFTDNAVYKLTLYFSTGLELNLERRIK